MKTDFDVQSEIEQTLARLRGIISSRVVMHAGTIQEIHVLAGTGRPAKQIVRDVETAINAQFGTAIDHRKISVAQLDSPEQFAPKPTRLILTSLRAEITPDASVVHVGLAIEGQELEGRAQGPRTPQNRGRLAATATLSALEPVLHPHSQLILDQHLHVPVGTRRVCLVSLVFSRPGHEEKLLGATIVESDHLEPAVKAVLTAVNRRLMHVLDPGLPMAT